MTKSPMGRALKSSRGVWGAWLHAPPPFYVLCVVGLTACAHPPAPVAPITHAAPGRFLHNAALNDTHVPAFANQGWAPFTRQATVAIALREWRLFGQPVDDDPPDTRPAPLPEDKPERMEGLWQRVGEYWWTGQEPDAPEVSWTGKHDETGTIFPANEDSNYAWSAAFISYVMRVAGASSRFPYAASHATYINLAAANASPGLQAEPIQAYAPTLGDLICTGRGRAASMRFTDLPTQNPFPSHCDIVVGVAPGTLTVIGGNVDDAVTEKHIPVSTNGMLAGADGRPVDTRYPWFVVLKVLYDAAPG
jgi:hypothetical protein